jgi:hypothetical protein
VKIAAVVVVVSAELATAAAMVGTAALPATNSALDTRATLLQKASGTSIRPEAFAITLCTTCS